jgi:hypothetical protein
MTMNKDKTQRPTEPTTPKAPFLEIRNWNKFQAISKTGKSLPWCKLYSAQADDIEYQRLSTFERGVLHDLYLVRTRTARPLHNDPTWLTRTTNTLPRYNARFTDAVHTLITRGFLTPTESVNLTCESEKESDGEKENEREIEREAQQPEKKPLVLTRPLSAKEKMEAVAAEFKAKRRRERESAL